jgi:ketosteroid isomerase-like protein
MRNCILAAVVIVVGASAARADDEKDVRDLSTRYAKAATQKDRAAMERLLHKDYHGVRLPVRAFNAGEELNRAQAVAAWTGPAPNYTGLEYTTAAVRQYGPTAVETGSVSVSVGPNGGPFAHIFRDVRYTRVWVKDDAGWRVAHESY